MNDANIKKYDDLGASSKDMHFSDQAMGAVMMALQKALMEQSDIVPTLKGFKFKLSQTGLMVMNPPIVRLGQNNEEEEE